MATDYMALAAQLRANRAAETEARGRGLSGTAANSMSGNVGQPMSPQGNIQPNGQDIGATSPLSAGVDMLSKYNQVSNGGLNKLLASLGGSGGAFTGASPEAMAAMSQGGGSSLGSMGLMGQGASGAGAGGAMSAAGPVGAFLAGSKALNDSGISSYGSTFAGKAPGKLIDNTFGKKFGNSALGALGKSVGSLSMGDIPGFAKDGLKAAKSFFTLDWL